MGMSKMIEGNTTMGDATTADDKKNDDTKNSDTKKKMDKPAKKTNQDLPMTPLDTSNYETDEAFEVGRAKRGGSKIDYASTVEDAYDQLNSILGSDGIKSLTSDTQNLMQQQKQLTEAMSQISPLMNNIGPLLKQAQTMMGTMKSNGGVDQLNQLAKQFNPSAIPKPTK